MSEDVTGNVQVAIGAAPHLQGVEESYQCVVLITPGGDEQRSSMQHYQKFTLMKWLEFINN